MIDYILYGTLAVSVIFNILLVRAVVIWKRRAALLNIEAKMQKQKHSDLLEIHKGTLRTLGISENE